MTDSLIDKARSGDPDAIGALLEQHTLPLRQALLPEMPERHRTLLSVDDVIQATFTDVFVNHSQIPTGDSVVFFAWLKQAAMNNLIDATRHLDAKKRPDGHVRIACGSADGDELMLLEQLLGGDSHSPSRSVAGRESIAALHNALSRLPDDNRLAVQGYDLEKLSITEVARALGRSPGAVHLLRNRAFKLLRAMLSR